MRPTDTVPAGPVAGTAFRTFRGPEDYPLMLEIIDRAKRADGIERTETLESITGYYAHLTNCDPYRDLTIVEAGGGAVAYGRVTWWRPYEGPPVYWSFGFVTPEWRRRGIGRALLHRNQARLRQIAAGHPAGPKLFDSLASDGEEGAHALLRADGYQPITFEADMVRPDLENIPPVNLPDELEIRPVSEDQVRTIWEADVEAFKDHWGAGPQTEEDLQGFIAFPHQDITLWKVAWDGDRVAGQVKSFINPDENAEYGRKRGYTESISTARRWRRRGVAKALIAASLGVLKERGMEEAALGVHTENPNGAFALYESMGFRVVRTSTTYRKPMQPDPAAGSGSA